jgi:hypothetical protein
MSTAVYTQIEVEKHNVKGDLWMIIHEKVYDVSTFAEEVSFFCWLTFSNGELTLFFIIASRW